MSDNIDITKAIKQFNLNKDNEEKYEIYFDEELGEFKYETTADEATIINTIKISDLKVDNASFKFGDSGLKLDEFKINVKKFFNMLKVVIKLQDKIVESLYKETLELCNIWDEVDDDGNPITLEYVKNHIDIVFLKIYKTSVQISATIYTDGDDENDGQELLGGHFIEAIIESDDTEIKWYLA